MFLSRINYTLVIKNVRRIGAAVRTSRVPSEWAACDTVFVYKSINLNQSDSDGRSDSGAENDILARRRYKTYLIIFRVNYVAKTMRGHEHLF